MIKAIKTPIIIERRYVPYANAIGSLMYAMVCTRHDLSPAILMVSGYMHDPDRGH